MRAAVAFEPPFPGDDLCLVPGKNLVTGGDELARALGTLTTLEYDLLTLAAAIFAVDLAAQRGEREGIVRDLRLSVPVVNHHAFRRIGDELADVLYLLSDDNWSVEFSPRAGVPEAAMEWPDSVGKTLLFSGGLDSLAAAVELLEGGTALQLASHYTANPVIQGSQQRLFGDRASRVAARITARAGGGLPFPSDEQREPTKRTRSFMFLTVGALAARRTGFHEVLMIAENGQMAIHLPLTAARLGAFSTHTAHPDVVKGMERLLGTLLSVPLVLVNPFLYRTKAECVAILVDRYSDLVPDSVSCWRSSRQAVAHCGECVPCLVRRIALEYHGMCLPEYARDLLVEDIATLPAEDVGKVNLNELGEFIIWFGGGYPDAKLEETFPDLISEQIDAPQAIGMYRRFAAEARTVLTRYDGVRGMLA